MKLRNKVTFMILTILSLISCGDGASYVITPGDDLHLAKDIELDLENAIFDDFATGVSSDLWYIGNQAWGGGNGGVIPQNVNYTDDGVLVLTGNGKYYMDGDVRGVGEVKDGRYTGAALISKFLVSAGRYEIKMKVLPRQGACTAFWIYANDVASGANHEIDIELPGGTHTGGVTFKNVLNTNYITEQYNQSQDVKVGEEIFDGEEVFLNDGEWHVYGFDWYTDPHEVVYYLDGKVTAVSDVFVPDMQSRLWLGCWFPVSSAFVGSANFETDNMYVDYVKYIPFKNQSYTTFNPPISGYAFENEYPNEPIATPNINKVANGTFEKLEKSLEVEKYTSLGGWTLTNKIADLHIPSELITLVENEGYDHSTAIKICDGGIASQYIDSVYHGYEYDFSFLAKGQGKVTINYFDKGNERIDAEVIEIENDVLQEYSLTIKAPSGTDKLQIRMETPYKSNSDSEYNYKLLVDNVSLLFK